MVLYVLRNKVQCGHISFKVEGSMWHCCELKFHVRYCGSGSTGARMAPELRWWCRSSGGGAGAPVVPELRWYRSPGGTEAPVVPELWWYRSLSNIDGLVVVFIGSMATRLRLQELDKKYNYSPFRFAPGCFRKRQQCSIHLA